MPQTCSICNHPDRLEIDTALIRGEAYRSIAKQFECSEASMYRHKRNCVKAAVETIQANLVEQTTQAVQEANAFVWNVFTEMEWLHRQVRLVYDETRAEKDHTASIKALGEARQQTKLFSELLHGMEPGQAEKLEQEWITVREAIFDALESYPDARLAVARALLALKRVNDVTKPA